MRLCPPLSSRGLLLRALARGVICFSLSATASLPAVAEEKPELSRASYFSRVWTVDDGLPHNAAHRLVQDARGHLWIASGAGLVRFDGTSFREFPLERAKAEANYNVRDLGVDAAGTVVLLPASGGVLQLKNDLFSAHPASLALQGKLLVTLFVQPDGVLWIETGEHDLVRWEKGNAVTYQRDHDIPAPMGKYSFAYDSKGQLYVGCGDSFAAYLDGKLVWKRPRVGAHILLSPARSGGIWVSSSEGLQKWDNGEFTRFGSAEQWRALAANAIQQVLEDRSGNLWVGTWRKGVFRFSGQGTEAIPTTVEGVTSLLEDTEGNIWVGTQGGGISRIRPTPFVALDYGNTGGDSLRSSFCEDETGALWLARRGGGLLRFFGNESTSVGVPGTGRQPEMYLVCPDKAGHIWVATSGGLFTLSVADPRSLEPFPDPVRDIRILFCAATGDLWIAHGETGLGYVHDGVYRESQSTDDPRLKRIRAVAESAQGTIWIATAGRSLFEIVEGNPVLRLSGAAMPGGQVNGMLFDSHGSLWLATSGGLVLKRGAELKNFGRNEGLSDEIISQFLEDDRGRLWCANRHGIVCIALDDFYAVAEGRQTRVVEANLGREDGLPRAFALTGSPPMPWKGRDGRLWFGTHGGYVGIDPKTAIVRQAGTPVYIDQVEVDGHSVNVFAPVRVPAGDHQLVFRFSAVNFSTPGKVHLRHRLAGFDSDWVDTGADRSATYANLAPGTYNLRVMAQSPDGSWSEKGSELTLGLAPAWWQTWLFRGAVGVILACAFGGLVRYGSQRRLRAKLEQLEREHQLERERARIARDLHDELGYSVTQIGLIAGRLKSESADPELQLGLGELASCSRRLSGELDGVVWTVSPKNDKWDRLASYVQQFALNFFVDTAIACTVEGTENAPETPLAPEAQHHVLAIVKEALNNCLKHARATRVRVSLAFSEEMLTLRIVDNGVGFDPEATEHSERNGLANLRTRAGELGAELKICSASGKGTELLLRLSIDTASPARPRSG